MAVKEYSLKKDGTKKIAPNFYVREFACQDGTDKILIAEELVTHLQSIRKHFDSPVIINSSFRTTEHNKSVGGSLNSQHMLGTAADITVKGVTPILVAQYAEFLLGKSGGLGLYGAFTHNDVRAMRSRWDQRSGVQVAVSGFPGYADGGDAEPEPAADVPVVVKCKCGETLDEIPGLMVNGSVYAPVRALSVVLGYDVEWTGEKVIVRPR